MPAVYSAVSVTTFKSPVNTTAAPAYPPGYTGIKQSAIQYKFNWETHLFRLHRNVNKALKLQILACIYDIYKCALKAEYAAYQNLSNLKVLLTSI